MSREVGCSRAAVTKATKRAEEKLERFRSRGQPRPHPEPITVTIEDPYCDLRDFEVRFISANNYVLVDRGEPTTARAMSDRPTNRAGFGFVGFCH